MNPKENSDLFVSVRFSKVLYEEEHVFREVHSDSIYVHVNRN